MAHTRLKELDGFRDNSSCCFCQQSVNDDLVYGKVYQFGDIITHYFCMLFSSSMEQNGRDEEGIQGFLPSDIKKELFRGRKLVCVFCHQAGATINCSFKGCKKRYHFPCAISNGALFQFHAQFPSFCSQHRRLQSVPRSALKTAEKIFCLMCQEEVSLTSLFETIWAPCCKTAWFHRLCVQRMAVSAGYFFKCPKCNNKEEFRTEMLECGIYIPDQDAAWELEPNAFHELNERHHQCDAEICKCPRGRTYSAREGLWDITLCSLCGSQGVHMRCGENNIDPTGQWTCTFCASIIEKMPPTASSIPGPSINQDGRRRRGRRGRRKREASPAETNEVPASKSIITEKIPENSNLQPFKLDNASTTTTCLFDNGGQPIHVVKLDNTHIMSDSDNVEEIGGVIVQDVINVDSSDDDEDCARLLQGRKIIPHSLPTTSSTMDHISYVIELSDSDDEDESANSKLSTSQIEDDNDVVFMGCHIPACSETNVQSPAMIRIIQNDNVLVLSPAEVMKRETLKQAELTTTAKAATVTSDGSNMIWQSVPRHKSMVHSIAQVFASASDLDRTFNCMKESNQNIPSITEQHWLQKIVPNGVDPMINRTEPITKGCEINEIINLD